VKKVKERKESKTVLQVKCKNEGQAELRDRNDSKKKKMSYERKGWGRPVGKEEWPGGQKKKRVKHAL